MIDSNNSKRDQAHIESEEFSLLDERLNGPDAAITHHESSCDIPTPLLNRNDIKNLDIQYALDQIEAFIAKFKSQFNSVPTELETAASVLGCMLALDKSRARHPLDFDKRRSSRYD
jgi:hypothetical protein